MNLTAVAGKTVSKMEFFCLQMYFFLSLDESRRFRMINKRKSHRVIIYAALVLGGFLLGFSKLRCVEFNAK